MGRMWKTLRKYPIITGILGTLCVMGIMSGYQFIRNHNVDAADYVTQELGREPTAEKLAHPRSLAAYMTEALKKRDADMALRGYALDECVLNVSLSDIIRTEGRFYTDMTVAPSGSYPTYNAVSAVELFEEAYAQLEHVWEVFPDAEQMEIKSIDYVKPEIQMGEECRSRYQKNMELWGGDGICEMAALVEYGQAEYLIGFTFVYYQDGYWKVLHLGSELSETTADRPVRQAADGEYGELKGRMEAEAFQEDYQELFGYEEMFGEETAEAGSLLLPPNYFILNSLKEETPEDVIKNFVLSIQKSDLQRAMAYCMDGGEDREYVTSALLEEQARAGRWVKRFCYGFLGCDYPQENSSLEQIGQSGKQITEKLDPQYFMYFDIMEMLPVESTENERQYLVCCYYEGDKYLAGFTLVNDGGWRISSLSSYDLEEGEIRKVSDEEYDGIKKAVSGEAE